MNPPQRLFAATVYVLLAAIFLLCTVKTSAADSDQVTLSNPEPVLVIHAGAGVEKGELTPEEEKQCHEQLATALVAGYSILESGGDAVDAVAAAVKSMEDSKVFNAGAGAVFNHDGKNELDAAIMDGKTHEAGSVADVTVIKNPIIAALTVMRKSKHVMLVGEGANQFARDQGLETRGPEYFYTQKRWDELQKELAKEKAENKKSSGQMRHHFGTVGAVALDKSRNLAAGTSTGGLTGKRWGRVGDSPIIGAGTYADDDSCAVSCTGHGEWFIRYNVAADLAARVKYQHQTVDQAAEAIIHGVLAPGHGDGGLIALDRNGKFTMLFNTEGMYRGYMTGGNPQTFIF